MVTPVSTRGFPCAPTIFGYAAHRSHCPKKLTGLSWTDTHGDLIAVINPATGDLITGGGYDPFGNPLPDTTDSTIGFQGGYTDPTTGDVNAHARWYDPDTGAFTSRDSWQLTPTPVAQTNRYLYGNASPLNIFDLSGHAGRLKTLTTVVIAPELAGVLTAYGTGVAISECARGNCGSALETGAKAATREWSEYWNGYSARAGGKGGSGSGGYVYRNQYRSRGTGNGTGTERKDNNGYDPGDWNIPGIPFIPWVPGVPAVPPVINWHALLTIPVGTAKDAADKAPDEVDILDGDLMKNWKLATELEDAGFIAVDADDNATPVWREEGEDCPH